MVLGWLALQLPGQYRVLVHHAVWKTAEGALFDVSPPPSPMYGGISSFIIDPSVEISLDYPPAIENRYLLTGDPSREGRLHMMMSHADDQMVRLNQQIRDAARELGFEFDRNTGSYMRSGELLSTAHLSPVLAAEKFMWDGFLNLTSQALMQQVFASAFSPKPLSG